MSNCRKIKRGSSLNRRQFLEIAAVGAAGFLSVPLQGAEATNQAQRLRTITYNIYGCQGYTETREAAPFLKSAASQIPARLAMELGLYNPDIVTFQESPPEKVVADIASRLGMSYSFFPSGYRSARRGSIGFPGAILTRFKIESTENCPLSGRSRPEDLFTRHWGRAVLSTPPGELVVYSAHLHPSDPKVRAREVQLILEEMEPDLRRRVSLLFQGDLNHVPEGPEYSAWKNANLTDTWSKVAGTARMTFGSHALEKRIDYIWAHGPIAELISECKVLFEGAFRTNPEDSRSFALSDHLPVFARFEGKSVQ